jgi:beta-glucosidase
MQGSDPKYFRVVSTPKHYAVHSGPEALRHGFNVDVSPHDLEDTYLPAFRATLVEELQKYVAIVRKGREDASPSQS